MKGKYRNWNKDHRGTSIVELLVIMAIVAVLVGMSTNLTGYLSGKQARQCAYKLEAAISEIRVETMSKSNGEKESVYLLIQNEEDMIYTKRIIRGKEQRDLVGEKVIVRMLGNNELVSDLSKGVEVPIYFNRATGALLEDSLPYSVMEIQQGRVVYLLTIEPTTGHVSCERK